MKLLYIIIFLLIDLVSMGKKAKLYTEDSTLNAFVNTWVGRPYK